VAEPPRAEDPLAAAREAGARDARNSSNPPRATFDPNELDRYSEAEQRAYWEGFGREFDRSQPATAPLPAPAAVAFSLAIAGLGLIAERLGRDRPHAGLIAVGAATYGLQTARTRAERSRARRLGIESAADQPTMRAWFPFTPPVNVPWSGPAGNPAACTTPAVLAASAAALAWLRRRRRPRRRWWQQSPWPEQLAGDLAREYLRRRDWRSRTASPRR
jgi:MYXO-CTERM domain-containing protein